MIYPWQHAQWQHLQQRLNEDRLAHALLFTGPEGVGKSDFAAAFAKSLLCMQPQADGQACGRCNSCLWSASGSHPDAHWITLEDDAKAISVNQIRSIAQFLSLKSQQGRHKVIVISPADKMNVNAANSLLKTLEEPSEHSVIILVTQRASALTATIRSRCQKLDFSYPSRSEAMNWLAPQLKQCELDAETLLAITKGSPLHALSMATNDVLKQRAGFFEDIFKLAQGQDHPIKIAEKWLKEDIQQNLTWFQTVLADMIKLNMLEKPDSICHTDHVEAMQKQARRLNLNSLYLCYERVSETQGFLKANINPQLIIESVLIPWTEMYKGK